MKRLYLLRHAQAQSTGHSDKTRNLSQTGIEQARALQQITAQHKFTPSVIACSPATRTRETCELVFPNFKSIDFPDGFFYASPDELLSYAQNTDDAHQSLLILNHNPAIQQLAFSMCTDGDDAKLGSIAMGYSPCTLSVIDCPVERWADLTTAKNTLVDLIPPTA